LVLNLDADHRLTVELQSELQMIFKKGSSSAIKWFSISRRTIFMDKWIRYGGHYPTYIRFYFKSDKGPELKYDQYFKVNSDLFKIEGRCN